jgi:xanthine dehydrogenase YagT iron-sulfur-binding subunit
MMVPKSRRSRALANVDELHALQSAFIEHEGFQCGHCTSGQIMSAIGCIAEGHAHSAEEIKFWMSGNICRCGAYLGIVAAIADVAARS